MELFKDHKNNNSIKESAGDDLKIYTGEDNAPFTVTKDQPEYNLILAIVKKINDKPVKESNDTTPLFTDYLSSKNKGLHYLNEDENMMVDETLDMFEKEYNGDAKNIDEGFLSKLVGGAAGFLAGPMIGKIIAKALGIEKGILYDVLCSRLVTTALGVAIGKSIGNKGEE